MSESLFEKGVYRQMLEHAAAVRAAEKYWHDTDFGGTWTQLKWARLAMDADAKWYAERWLSSEDAAAIRDEVTA